MMVVAGCLNTLTKFVVMLLFRTPMELKHKLLIELLYHVLASRRFGLLLGTAVHRVLCNEARKRIFLVVMTIRSVTFIF